MVRYVGIVNKNMVPIITTLLLCSYALKTDHNFAQYYKACKAIESKYIDLILRFLGLCPCAI